MNPVRSVFTGDARPKSLVVRIERHAKGEVFTLETVRSDNLALTSSLLLYLDGKARESDEGACSGFQSSRRLDSWTVEVLRTCNRAWTRLVRRLTTLKELVLDITEQRAEGGRSTWHVVLEKQ